MENPLLTKEKIIKRLLIMLFGTAIFAGSIYFLIFKQTNVMPFLIAFAFILLVFALMAIIEFTYKPKNETKIAKNSYKITAYFNIGLGICAIIISSIKIAEGKNSTELYVFVIAGIIMIFNGIRIIKNKRMSIYGINVPELKK